MLFFLILVWITTTPPPKTTTTTNRVCITLFHSCITFCINLHPLRLFVYVCIRDDNSTEKNGKKKRVYTFSFRNFSYCCYFYFPNCFGVCSRYEKCTNDTWVCDIVWYSYIIAYVQCATAFYHFHLVRLLFFLVFRCHSRYCLLLLLLLMFILFIGERGGEMDASVYMSERERESVKGRERIRKKEIATERYPKRTRCLVVYSMNTITFDSESESVTIGRREHPHMHIPILS